MLPAPAPSWLTRVRGFARDLYAELDFAHDLTHGERVVRLAERLRREEGGDPELVEAGAWLHQLHDDLDRLAAFLGTLAADRTLRERLQEIVALCRPERIATGSPIEAKIVFDADALEVLGPYGTVRELLCNARVRGRDWPTSVAETRAVQARLRRQLMTDAARRLAAEPLTVCDRFWEDYDRWEKLP